MNLVARPPVSRVLLRVPNWLGDAVMCEPAIRAVREVFPQAAITILARAAVAEVLAGHPAIQQAIVYDHRGRHAGLRGKWVLAQQLRAGRFEVAILFQNAFEAALLTRLAGIPTSIGYATDGRRLLLSQAVPVPTTEAHQVDYYLTLMRAIGWTGSVTAPRLTVRDEERRAVEQRLAAAGVGAQDVLIGLNPGSTYGGAKRWLPERFAETAVQVCTRIRQQGLNPRVVIVGAAGEEALAHAIAQRIGAETLVWSGTTTVRELIALTARCRLYITNDTGPMHIAAACGVPLVAIFGPTDWKTTAPFGDGHALVRQPVDCAPCLLRECPIDHRCMIGVTVEQVVAAAHRLVQPDAAALPSHRSRTLDGVTIYLDRDGTLIRDVGYLNDPDRVEWLPTVREGLAQLKAAGARIVVVTNQSGVARGTVSMQQLTAIHRRMEADLSAVGVTLDGWFLCPHHPDDGCACRKPNIGLVEQSRKAAEQSGYVRRREYVVGDMARDIELGHRIGARTLLVATGPSSQDELTRLRSAGHPPDFVAADYAAVTAWILADAAQVRAVGDPAGELR